MARYIEVELDHPRRMGYTWRDAEDLSVRLGGIDIQEMLRRLGNLHPVTLRQFLWTGLANHDRGLSYERTADLIETHLEKGGSPADLVVMILDALDASGVVQTRRHPTADRTNGVPAGAHAPLGAGLPQS